MEYRSVDEHESADGERFAMQRQSIQHTMQSSGPEDLLDSLLVITNICEQRGLLTNDKWYQLLSLLLRSALRLVTLKPTGPRPDASLEDPLLYFPDVDTYH